MLFVKSVLEYVLSALNLVDYGVSIGFWWGWESYYLELKSDKFFDEEI